MDFPKENAVPLETATSNDQKSKCGNLLLPLSEAAPREMFAHVFVTSFEVRYARYGGLAERSLY